MNDMNEYNKRMILQMKNIIKDENGNLQLQNSYYEDGDMEKLSRLLMKKNIITVVKSLLSMRNKIWFTVWTRFRVDLYRRIIYGNKELWFWFI